MPRERFRLHDKFRPVRSCRFHLSRWRRRVAFQDTGYAGCSDGFRVHNGTAAIAAGAGNERPAASSVSNWFRLSRETEYACAQAVPPIISKVQCKQARFRTLITPVGVTVLV